MYVARVVGRLASDGFHHEGRRSDPARGGSRVPAQHGAWSPRSELRLAVAAGGGRAEPVTTYRRSLAWDAPSVPAISISADTVLPWMVRFTAKRVA